jgi:hypothetical protein
MKLACLGRGCLETPSPWTLLCPDHDPERRQAMARSGRPAAKAAKPKAAPKRKAAAPAKPPAPRRRRMPAVIGAGA